MPWSRAAEGGTGLHPWAEDVAEHTLAQTALISATTPTGLALRQVLSDLITDLPDLSLKLARRLAGLDVHYGRTDQHRLVGARVKATATPCSRDAPPSSDLLDTP
jgi:hypothetical protein